MIGGEGQMPQPGKHPMPAVDPLWYKDAVIYELHVRAFSDSNGDGMGDFRGLTGKLDYLQDLGVTAIWLLPFYPSPWKDDGYDISGYTDIHPAYGSMRDFQAFLRAAHERNLRVITELVLNHTSDKHPWFQRARSSKPGSRWRNFYVWSDSAEKYPEARIIFKDFESSNWTWDPVAKAYYWHRFYSHQPDLNFENPAVRRAMLEAVDFWFSMGVDGLRLDAVPYLYEREGTDCENLEETHRFLRELRRHIDSKYESRMLLGEANQWPEDAVAYFGEGRECHMAFHFPLMPRLFMALMREDRYPILDILEHTPPIEQTCQWALFLRNHDELTLEMVTDEERDYMYRVYANAPQARINLGIRRRLAPLLGNHRRRIELLNALLFTLPGTPVIYYGDEIGMGDNIYMGDRNGVRTPMQWNADRNAGFSRANPQRLYLPVIIDPEYHYEALNVEAQQNNPHSLLWWMKRLIALRKRSKALSRGSIEFLEPDNHKVLTFLRQYQEERLLVVANLSRFSQPVEIDLSAFIGFQPVEMFGRIAFPVVGDAPYLMTLAPHTFYLFTLEQPAASRNAPAVAAGRLPAPQIEVESIESVFHPAIPERFSALLPSYLQSRRWFRGKARNIRSVDVVETIPILPGKAYVLFIRVGFSEGNLESYCLPVCLSEPGEAGTILRDAPHSVIARLRTPSGEMGLLYSAERHPGFCSAIFDAIGSRHRFKGVGGELRAKPSRLFPKAGDPHGIVMGSRILQSEQSNTSIVYFDESMGDQAVFKLFRCIEAGTNPDLEIGRFLTEKASYKNTPPVWGSVEYRSREGEVMTIGILQGFVPNEGDAWRFTLDSFGRYLELAMSDGERAKNRSLPCTHPLELAAVGFPDSAGALMGGYLQDAGLMGKRTAELHLALCRDYRNPDFEPEPFTDFYRNSLYHGIAVLVDRTFKLLRSQVKRIPESVQPAARRVLGLESEVRARIELLREIRVRTVRIRHHGDYHLGQVLFTGKDFYIIDFEGEPARSLSARRIKRSPLRDVAGMLRSFHYAASAVRFGLVPGVYPHFKDDETLEYWIGFWYLNAGAAFLKGYFDTAGDAPFIPETEEDRRFLLDVFLLEKAVYEVSYELNNRPDWVGIPLQGICDLLATGID
jgi:maltose alpha-D-glucosyltransferase/alpha-amylase